MTELPKIKPIINGQIQPIEKDYSYSEIVQGDIDIKQINAIIFSDDDLSRDMTALIHLCDISSDFQLKFKDFTSALFVDAILKKQINNKTFLIDDSLRKDRSYIDLTRLSNIKLTIPLNYLMWGVKFNESVDTYCFSVFNDKAGYVNQTSLNGNERISYEDYIKLSTKIEELSKINVNSSQEKVALISDYIQSCTQYIAGYQSDSSLGTFITPDFPVYDEYRKFSGLVETVLNCNNGICMGIANLSTLLLNNDMMDVEVESVFGSRYVWNKVLIDGKYYYFDNTWSITRNEKVSKEGLVALSFTKKYLLFGQKTAISIGYHNPQSIFIYDGVICDEDMEKQDYESKFVYKKHPIYRSIKK